MRDCDWDHIGNTVTLHFRSLDNSALQRMRCERFARGVEFDNKVTREMEVRGMNKVLTREAMMGILALVLAVFLGANGFAHCDTTGGPIIPEAMTALGKGEITPILKWIKKENEEEIKTAFTKTIAVRSMGPEAKELADRYFIETLVRLHRGGEGAPFTYIKDEPVESIVALADKALADGSADEMIGRISEDLAGTIREKFKKVLQTGKTKDKSVEAGRKFVAAYVTYVHYVESIHAAIMSAAGHQHQAVH